jgi:hypothetical protein
VALCVAGSAIVASAVELSSGATAGTTASRHDPQPRALLVSDSAWLGIKTYGAVDAVQGFEHMLDLASCRRRVTPSCRNYDGHVPVTLLDEVRWRRGVYDTLIVATGYNDSDHNFRDDVATITELTRSYGYERVVWLTLRSNVSYSSPGGSGFNEVFARNNATLRELADSGDYPELVIADWATYARDMTEWFARDGIHLRRSGPWAAADYISRKIAFLDQQPCAMPAAAGAAPLDPCPDPDAGSPAVDLEAIYPIGQPYPWEPFQMEWEGHSSWPDTPRWER